MSEYKKQVYDLVSKIPKGCVATYGQIALWTGNPMAARAVGTAMRSCPDTLCWFRVVRADGSMVFEIQRSLLESEGVCFLSDGRVDMKQHAMKETI